MATSHFNFSTKLNAIFYLTNVLLAAVIFTQMDERKQKLIQALKDERLQFMKRGADTTEHDIAIDYLINGKTSSNPDKWELLDACMNDYDTMLSDYGC